MLPRPRYFEQRAQSAYLASRAETIMARAVQVPLP
jgi:monofunctional biosynthetic peptidoglycan transglycosylase